LTGLTVAYVLNDFSLAGAEQGLVTLLRHGLFAGADIHIVGLFRGSGALLRELQRSSLTVQAHTLLPAERFSVRATFTALAVLRRKLTDLAPEIVVASLPQANILTRAALMFDRRPVLCAFEHNTRLARWFYYPLLIALSPRVDVILSDSKSSLRAMRRSVYLPGRYAHLELPLFVAGERGGLRPRRSSSLTLFSVSRLVRQKRVDLVLRALARLAPTLPPFEYTVFGDGPCRPELEQLANELGLADKVRFRGFVGDWQEEAASFDVFVHASEHEGLSLVTLEAMELGVAVLVSAVGGIREYAKHLENAYLMRDLTSDGIADGLSALLLSIELRETLGQKAGRTASTFYSHTRAQQRIRRLHRIVCECAHTTRSRPRRWW
jgi:glycosyltransferase involved in cell wall biosynthesis